MDHKNKEEANVGQEVCIRVEAHTNDQNLLYGRQFDHKNQLVSQMTRKSIEALKENYRNKLKKEDWGLVAKLKRLFRL